MICIVLHCDVDGCGCEQGYPIETLEAQRGDEDMLYLVAVRLGAMYGWRYSDADLVYCPEHSGEGD